MHHSIISGDLLFKKGCALFHTTKCFKGDQDCVLQSGPQKPQEKLVPVAPIMRGDKTNGILGTVQRSAAKKIRSWFVRQKDVEESLPCGP
jgi:hypothetical protein